MQQQRREVADRRNVEEARGERERDEAAADEAVAGRRDEGAEGVVFEDAHAALGGRLGSERRTGGEADEARADDDDVHCLRSGSSGHWH